MTTESIVGIAFAAVLAGILLLIVLLAIFVPSIRARIASSGVVQLASMRGTQRRTNTGATSPSHTASHGEPTSPRFEQASSTSEDPDTEEAMKVIERVPSTDPENVPSASDSSDPSSGSDVE